MLESKVGILSELCSEGIMPKSCLGLFAYYFLKEGLEYAYPARAFKKLSVHADFEFVLDATKRILSNQQ